ncbi:EamA family transporter [Xenophilus sp. AP218F]|nr:EamA family transporter [Xenophilus sp. AP218F]
MDLSRSKLSAPDGSRHAYGLLTLTTFLWSSNFVVARALHGQIGPFAMAFGRWGFALLCILPFAWPRLAKSWPQLRAQWRVLLLLGASGIATTNTMIYLAVQTTTATNAVILNSVTPVLVLLMGALCFRQRLRGGQLGGMLLALGGALLIMLKGDWRNLAGLHFGGGDICILIGGVAWAVYTLGLRKLKPGLDARVLMFSLLAIGEILLLPLFVAELLTRTPMPALGAAAWGALLYLGALPSVAAFLMYNRAIGLVGAARAASFLYLMPAFGALLSIGLLGESLQWFHAAGLAAIFGGIALSSRRRREAAVCDAALPAGGQAGAR